MPSEKWIMEFDADRSEQVQTLLDEANLTRVEFLNNILTMAMWAIRHIKKGHEIAAINDIDRKYYELQMDFLDRFRSKPSVSELSPQDFRPDHTE